MAKEMNDRFAHLIRSDTTHPGRGKLVAAGTIVASRVGERKRREGARRPSSREERDLTGHRAQKESKYRSRGRRDICDRVAASASRRQSLGRPARRGGWRERWGARRALHDPSIVITIVAC
eukprot:scaffold241986_cov35-Tisochrysis_lutea.AAC.1